MRKVYRGRNVLAGVDLAVPVGTVYALLDPNGAGRTTTVRILSALLPADAGTARVAGYDVRREPDRVRAAIGVTGQFCAVDAFLTGRENLRMTAALGHLDRRRAATVVDRLPARFDLGEAATRRAATYSGGMRRRLDLAMTLVPGPRVVFLVPEVLRAACGLGNALWCARIGRSFALRGPRRLRGVYSGSGGRPCGCAGRRPPRCGPPSAAALPCGRAWRAGRGTCDRGDGRSRVADTGRSTRSPR